MTFFSMHRLVFIATLVLPLAACSPHWEGSTREDGGGPSVADSDGGNPSAQPHVFGDAGGNGRSDGGLDAPVTEAMADASGHLPQDRAVPDAGNEVPVPDAGGPVISNTPDTGAPPPPQDCSTLGCGPHSTCVADSTGSTHSCQCDAGYSKNAITASCDDVCLNPRYCGPVKTCGHDANGATCSCPPPTYGLNLLSDPDFEGQGLTLGGAWYPSSDSANPVFSVVDGHTGSKAARVAQSSGWVDLWQAVSLQPNAHYLLTGWVRTSGSSTYFGLRKMDATGVAQVGPISNTSWVQQSVEFDSGSLSTVDVYIGTWAVNGAAWVETDDLSLQQVTKVACQ
ncbi:MAG: Basic proline-rich protein [Myxococcaceae bacterium]|nr:Basic proline-rich protein [Myxococcaceae bacterium]